MTRGRILYVEDNLENRILVKRVLESEGFTVFDAETGNIGLSKAETVDPDLILMDINLPDIDGYNCTALLRKLPKLSKTPIIALTANVMEGDRQKAIDAGLDGYIPKPIDIDALPRQIDEHMKLGVHGRAVALPAAATSEAAKAPAPTAPSMPAAPQPPPPAAPSAMRPAGMAGAPPPPPPSAPPPPPRAMPPGPPPPAPSAPPVVVPPGMAVPAPAVPAETPPAPAAPAPEAEKSAASEAKPEANSAKAEPDASQPKSDAPAS